jgi:hypothetical protein
MGGKIRDQVDQIHLSCKITFCRDLCQFWEPEEVPKKKRITDEEDAQVEQHFIDNVTHDSHGQYSVKLPLNKNIQKLGDSYSTALKRVYALQFRLNENPLLKK